MPLVLEQIAIGSRYISLSNRIFLKATEKSMLPYWVRSSKDPDKQPFHLLRFPMDFLEVTDASSLPESAGCGGRRAAPLGHLGRPVYSQALGLLSGPGRCL